jgi:endonuclease G, mitochondrial
MPNIGFICLKSEKKKMLNLIRCISVSILIAISYASLGQEEAVTIFGKKVLLFENGTWKYKDSIAVIPNLEIPKYTAKEDIIKHTVYTLSYNEKHEQANWVAYYLSKDRTNKAVERGNKFMIDPKVKTGSATDADYQNSGYDRGHLAPAADMGWSETTMKESFYFSNMSPQEPSFNRGIWKKLEELVRTWAIEYNLIYVATGPVLEDNLNTIGENKVSVPKYYYKVILDYHSEKPKGIGFILPNKAYNADLQTVAISIDSVQKVTSIDFFHLLPDEIEHKIEETICAECWTWKKIKPEKAPLSEDNIEITSSQCKGITKEGSRCKNSTKDASGYCLFHTK